jgi:NAD(P)H-dependent flavin oxidoreductase YrpB (nitropropane dioxygenase family)
MSQSRETELDVLNTDVTHAYGIDVPIIQDGMGPFSTAAVAAAVSTAGGLGSLSNPGMSITVDEGLATLRLEIERCASLTSGPFALNVPFGRLDSGEILPLTEAYIELAFEMRNADAALAKQFVGITTSAGFPGDYSKRIRDEGLIHAHKVGSVRHAEKAAATGVDFVIASGYEMGGHTHSMPVHTFVLAASVLAEVDIPVIVSGGVFNGCGLAGALGMGACGVAMGTRFIATRENDWHEAYKQKIVNSPEGGDVVFPGFYGPARGLDTPAVEELAALVGTGEMDLVAMARWKEERMVRAMRDGDMDSGLVPAGQCASGIKSVESVQEILDGMVRRAEELLRHASSMISSPRTTHVRVGCPAPSNGRK